MQEIFEKIIERLEGRRGIAARDKYESKSSDDRSYYQGADYGYYKAIEIVNQVAEEYKHGHFGCNMNGQHEKCKNCGLRGECSHCNTKWFTEHSNSEIPNMSENLTSSDDGILNINGIFDILDQFHFFLGQRAGRELWGDKPRAVQDRDIANFNRNLQIIRNYIKQNTASSDVPDINVGKIDEVCEWRLCDEEANVYDTACGNSEMLFDGSPSENEYEFCPYCGKKIKVVE